MGSWRGQQQQQGYAYSQQHHIPWTKSFNRKPPQDSWQSSVPYWEKNFCKKVGSVPWQKLVETKRCMYLYENIVQWNDSAAEDAFKNAKSRFWAEINGLPCSISLPDPDIYIDEIDWNSSIDSELILDLEREPNPSPDEAQDEVVVVGKPLPMNLPLALQLGATIPATGWGEADEDFQNKDNPENQDCGWNADNKENPWEPVPAQNNAAVGGWDNSWNNWENNLNEGKINMDYRRADGGLDNSWNYRANKSIEGKNNMDYGRADGGFWGKSDANNRKKEGGSWYNSRYKTSRFHGDYYQKDRGWRNGGRRNRVHAGYENLA